MKEVIAISFGAKGIVGYMTLHNFCFVTEEEINLMTTGVGCETKLIASSSTRCLELAGMEFVIFPYFITFVFTIRFSGKLLS